MAYKRKPRTEFGRVVQDVIQTDDLKINNCNVCAVDNKRYQRKSKRCVTVASTYNGLQMSGGLSCDPRLGIAKSIREALNPDLARRPCKTLADMSPEERAEMARLYASPKRSVK